MNGHLLTDKLSSLLKKSMRPQKANSATVVSMVENFHCLATFKQSLSDIYSIPTVVLKIANRARSSLRYYKLLSNFLLMASAIFKPS